MPGSLYTYDNYVYPGQTQANSRFALPVAYAYQGAVVPGNVWPHELPREQGALKLSRIPQRSYSARIVPVNVSQEFAIRDEVASAPPENTGPPEAWNLIYFTTEASKRRGVPDDFPIYNVESTPMNVEVAGKKKGIIKRALSSMSFRNKISI
ncbi:Hypp3304 [Branchiostoma lanceolatum]|nr:Hypp3304 [Branchiostoma lanceolatum]